MHCARCHRAIAPASKAAISAASASGTVTWCSEHCAAHDGWPDDIGAVQRAMTRGEAATNETAFRIPPGHAAGAGPVSAEMPVIPAEGVAAPAAGGSPASTPRIPAMPELRISVTVPLTGDLFDQAPVVARIGTALEAFRAALAEASADATIAHEVVTPRPRGAKA